MPLPEEVYFLAGIELGLKKLVEEGKLSERSHRRVFEIARQYKKQKTDESSNQIAGRSAFGEGW